jgi:hypothetical protein
LQEGLRHIQLTNANTDFPVVEREAMLNEAAVKMAI